MTLTELTARLVGRRVVKVEAEELGEMDAPTAARG